MSAVAPSKTRASQAEVPATAICGSGKGMRFPDRILPRGSEEQLGLQADWDKRKGRMGEKDGRRDDGRDPERREVRRKKGRGELQEEQGGNEKMEETRGV